MGQARLIPRPGQDRGQEDALDAGFGQLMHVAEGELDRQAGLGRELAQTGLQGRVGSGPGGYVVSNYPLYPRPFAYPKPEMP